MSKYSIPILLGTTRRDNQSARVARYLHDRISSIEDINSTLLDLGKSDFPLLVDRVSNNNPITNQLEEWTKIIQSADGIVIVSPEYKSGYPGSLKNFLDYLPPGVFRYKPIGISTVSSGIYAGTSCLQQLRQVVIAMAGMVIPDRFQVGTVQSAFNEQNEMISEQQNKVAHKFIDEMIKYTRILTPLKNK